MSVCENTCLREAYNQVMEITPTMAARWLEANEGNRRLNWTYITQLARDMKAGRFVCTHQGIAFDTGGRLIDGQHRLWAIIEADVPVQMRVFFNEPSENLMYVDGNTPRRAADRMTLGRVLGTVRTDELATLRAMLGGFGMSTRRATVHEEMEAMGYYRAAIRFAHEHLGNIRLGGIANAMTRAVIARGWWCIGDRSLLARFCEVLRSGASSSEREHLIVMLRNQLVDISKQSNTRWGRQRQYALTSRALLAFFRDERLSVLRPGTGELFLLPQEAE